jgi:hypothetical protein
MTHHNDFILALKYQGKVLRESNGKVFLPFNSEYSLLLKNNRSYRAMAQVFIDGMDVSDGREFVIDPHSNMEIERFLLDGNFDKGNKFKFVKSDHKDVVDPSSSDNGIVKVIFWEEQSVSKVEYVPYYPYYPSQYQYYTYPQFHYPPLYDTHTTIRSNSMSNSVGGGGTESSSFTHSSTSVCTHYGEETGATIEGDESSQHFNTVWTMDKNYSTETVLQLQIVPTQKPVTVQGTRRSHCPKCNYKIKNSWTVHFCPHCGTRLNK